MKKAFYLLLLSTALSSGVKAQKPQDTPHSQMAKLDRGLIAFPADDQYVIYGYDPARGFYPQAALDLEEWSWNTRGLYVDDMLYVVGDEAITVISLDGFKLVKTVEFP